MFPYKFKPVQDGGFTSRIETNHKDTHVLFVVEEGPDGTEGQTHGFAGKCEIIDTQTVVVILRMLFEVGVARR